MRRSLENRLLHHHIYQSVRLKFGTEEVVLWLGHIIFSNIYMHLPTNVFLFQVFEHKLTYYSLPSTCYMSRQSHPLFFHPNNISWVFQVMKILIFCCIHSHLTCSSAWNIQLGTSNLYYSLPLINLWIRLLLCTRLGELLGV